MIEPSRYIRKAFYDSLKNNVIFKGKAVPVYDVFSDEYEGANQIILSNQSTSDVSDKCNFVWDCSLVIDVVTRTTGAGNRSTADFISEQVTNVLQPQRRFINLLIDGQFTISNLELSSMRYLTERTQSNFLVRKLLTYDFRIFQN